MHLLLPLVAELALQVLDRGLDGATGPVQVDVDEPVVVLHDPAVDDDGVHVTALRLEDDVPVGVQHREHHR